MIKNVLILGGSYFAGRCLVEQLKERMSVNVFTFNRGNIPLNLTGVTELRGDRTRENSILQNIPALDWDVVVDFCGYGPEDIETVIKSIPGTINHYIFISTASVYDHAAMLPLDETARTIDKPQPELGEYADYAFNKIRAEYRLADLCRENGIAWTVLRPSILYGKFNYAHREAFFFNQMVKDIPIVLPAGNIALFSFLFVEDFAAILIQCMGNELVYHQVFNTVSPELVSYRTYVDTLSAVAGKPVRTISKTHAQIIEDNIALPFPMDHHQVYSGVKLNQVLHVKFTPLVLGMKKTYAFYQHWLQKKGG